MSTDIINYRFPTEQTIGKRKNEWVRGASFSHSPHRHGETIEAPTSMTHIANQKTQPILRTRVHIPDPISVAFVAIPKRRVQLVPLASSSPSIVHRSVNNRLICYI